LIEGDDQMTRDPLSYFRRAVGPARKSARVPIAAMVKLRRRGHHNFTVKVFNLSKEGCKLEFLERPELEETVWVKFEGLDLLQAKVCWLKDLTVGVEFERPLHEAVFETLTGRLKP
jgi:hypothetical protein